MPNIRYSDELHIRNFGPFPVLVPLLHRLQLCETIDTLVPCTGYAKITHGQVIAALVLNRMISPRAIYSMGHWANHVAITEALAIPPHELNDDRILRALDAIFPQLEALQGSLAWRAIESFDLATSILHWDLASFFFEGCYEEERQDSLAPLINYGCPKPQDAGKPRK